MVRIWKKEKESCGGKLIATDFKRLNPKIFYPVHELTKEDLNKELALFAPDGKIYVNTKIGMESCFFYIRNSYRTGNGNIKRI